MTVRTRTVFLVIAPPGTEPMAMSHHIPANQTLSSVVQLMLALSAAHDAHWGTPDEYVLQDLYGQALDPGIQVGQVPFPGCVVAVSRRAGVEMNGETLTGERAEAALVQWITSKLYAGRDDQADAISRRYGRFLRSGAWSFEPQPITSADLGLTYHESDGAPGRRLLARLTARGLSCAVRVSHRDGSCEMSAAGRSPAEQGRALVTLIGEQTADDPWVAYDVGAAWALGIPVVPVLTGAWRGDPPDILSPYQRLSWDEDETAVVEELAALLGPASQSLGDLLPGNGEAQSRPD